MLKSLLSVCSIFVLLLPNCFLPNRAAACPVKLPETLLSLYRRSDAIYIGRFDKVEDHEIVENSDERTVVNIQKHFDISSALKGDSRKFFILEDQERRYKAREGAGEQSEESIEQSEEEEEDLYRAASLKSGDLVLLFLKKGEDGTTLELTDYRDAIKKMTQERLDVYEARIRELNSIFSAKKVDDAAIVDWLVRCTEDAATRWEGAFELIQSVRRFEWIEQQEAEAEGESEEEAEQANAEPAEEAVVNGQAAGEAEAEDGDSGDFDNSVYASLLTDNHKQALMNTVLASAGEATPDPAKTKVLSAGDRVLIELVSKWGDNRLAKYLIDRLQVSSDDPYVISNLMSSIAGILADDDLEKLSGKYSDSDYQDDGDLVDEDEDGDSGDGGSEDKPDSVEQTEVKGSDSPDARRQPETAPDPKITYKQLRDELLAKFIDRSMTALAIAESQKEDRTSR